MEREKTIAVTIHLYEDGLVSFDFYEGETGDTNGYCTDLQHANRIKRKLGEELLGWLDIMAEGGE